MAELSPAAQAVLDAAQGAYWKLDAECPADADAIAAAALRAVASNWKGEIQDQPNTEFIGGIKNCIDALNELAEDLEASMTKSKPEPRRFDIKSLLRDPATRQELMDGAVDFICKVEGIRD